MKPSEITAALIQEIEGLPEHKTGPIRQVRRRYSRQLAGADAEIVFQIADGLLDAGKYRFAAYELIRDHPAAFRSLDRSRIESLARGMASWGAVDSFARTLSGPAWKDGQLKDGDVRDWARSQDRWWRRAALVSTVAFNVRSQGGQGDTGRTLAICRMLAADRDDMVVKALSWALRELVPHDPQAVRDFLAGHPELASRVRREVTNKLDTGLKNP